MAEAPVGGWQSPITSDLITSQSIGLSSAVAGSDGYVYWIEGRPTEGGRQVLVRSTLDGKVEDVTPPLDSGFNVRTRVHEYGGGAFIIGDGVIYFSNFKDQNLYSQKTSGANGAPQPLLPADTGYRFADGVVDPARNRLVLVREDHSAPGEAVNTVCAISLDDGSCTVLASGGDFYASPRLSEDGSKLAYVTWNHPNMPWDDVELWLADLAPDGSPTTQRKVAGGKDESVMQPSFDAAGNLYFISDRSGWWNLYRETAPGQVEALCPRKAEFGGPAWLFGSCSYRILSDGRLLVQYSDPTATRDGLAVLDPKDGSLKELQTDYYSFGRLSVAEANGKLVLATVGSSPVKPTELVFLEVGGPPALASSTPDQWRVLRKASNVQLDPGYLSAPESIEFPTEGGLTAYMNYYAPHNKDFKLPPGEQPPVLVKIHGGPTSQASTGFNLLYQYWTSRGYGIADVNYGGSTGYGREYRNRLRGTWGVVDVDDCCNAARHLAQAGRADPARLCISGGSAGGYTTLACLAFRDVFKAGASLYGVADLELLAQDTHKFESRYLDGLIGPYPEKKSVYIERSPIHAIDKFDQPIAFFQGDEDKVVPPNQAELMFEAIKKKGVTTALVMFKGEQHGFRAATAIRRALDGEFFFYGKALGFNATMPGDLEPIDVVNV